MLLDQVESPATVPPLSSSPVQASARPADLVYYAARQPWQLVDVAELWKHRDLVWILGMRDLQVRYRQTIVGIAWALLQPLMSMVIFSTLFRLLNKEPVAGNVPYPLVLLCGLVPWQLFASIVTQATSSLVSNQAMVSKVYFPRLALPLSTAIPAAVDFLIALGLVLLGLAVFRVWPTWTLVTAPLFAIGIALAGLAIGIWFAALNAMYRDIGFVVPFFVQVGFFVSPVIYNAGALIPSEWRGLYWLNPMAGLIEGFRWSITPDQPFPLAALLIGTPVLLGALLSGLAYFRRIERYVADCI